jgi:hypothetical protein
MIAKLQKPLDTALFSSVAEQLMSGSETISVDGRTVSIQRTGRQRLRYVRFAVGGLEYEAIEQNAAKPSRWGQLARAGHRVVQFRDVPSDRYVAVSVDGRVTIYGSSS